MRFTLKRKPFRAWTRTRRKFLLWPRTVVDSSGKREMRWLEWATVLERRIIDLEGWNRWDVEAFVDDSP